MYCYSLFFNSLLVGFGFMQSIELGNLRGMGGDHKKTAPLAWSRWRFCLGLSLDAFAVFAARLAFLPGAVLFRALRAGLLLFGLAVLLCATAAAICECCGRGEEDGRGGQ
jgi:hypothetical protein